MTEQPTFQVIVTHYSLKGHGVAKVAPIPPKTKAKRVEIPGAVVGDHLEVRPFRQSHFGMVASIEKELKAGSGRCQARCAHVGKCGGCTWQQIDYQEQLRLKEEHLKMFFGKWIASENILPIKGCADPWFYRNKMELTFSENIRGDRFLGLVMAETQGRVLNLAECYIAPAWQQKLIEALRAFWEKNSLPAWVMQKNRGVLRKITLRHSKKTGAILLNLAISGNEMEGMTKEQIHSFVEHAEAVFSEEERKKLSFFLTFVHAVKGEPTQSFEMHLKGPTRLHERLKIDACGRQFEMDLWISPSAFLQPNTLQAESMYSAMIEMVQPEPSWKVIDLYCGVGAIGFAFAPYVQEVIGLEINPYAIYDGEYIAAQKGIKNIKLIAADASLWEEKAPLSKADLLIVDPPRIGLGLKTIASIAQLQPKRILYVSCNPQSQAKDLQAILQIGYEVISMQAFDQFPHTPHVENIIFLKAVGLS